MKITVSHSGKQHSYHLAKALLNLGALDKFYTSSYVGNSYLQDYFLKSGNTFFTRRFEKGLSSPYVNSNWRFEVKEVLLRAIEGKSERAQNAVYQRDIDFDEMVSKKLKSRNSNAFWGFQGSSLASLKAANELGKTSIVELSTAYVKSSIEILGEEAKLHPEFADSLDNLVFPSNYQKRLEEEPHIAKKVISALFTTQSLLNDGVSRDKIIYLPLGFSMDYVPYTERKEDTVEKRTLKLLYAGTLTQRKGIKYLLEAMQRLKPHYDIELTVVGGVQGSGKGLEPYKNYYTHINRVSQLELFKMYGNFDALVLPTVFEGFGLVIVEAMAAGLPVITTPHSMGPELIKSGENGYIIPIRGQQELEQAIISLRELSSAEYLQMRKAARKSVEAFTWDAYAIKLSQLLPALL